MQLGAYDWMFLVQLRNLSVVRLAPKNEVIIVKCINMVRKKKYTSWIGTFDTKPKNKNPLSTDYACPTRILNELAHFKPYISNFDRMRIQISWRGSFCPSQINHLLQFTFKKKNQILVLFLSLITHFFFF